MINRTIKFRIWDSISRKYHDWEIIKFMGLADFNLDHYTIEQFTGLQDKNFYEGDIIGRTGFFDRVIIHDGINFRYYFTNDKSNLILLHELSFDEHDTVIGNIHE
jgi:hypothetical protein